jgi:hypothetical protein
MTFGFSNKHSLEFLTYPDIVKEWNHYLNLHNHKLFAKIELPKEATLEKLSKIGPHLTPGGDIQGDFMKFEETLIDMYGNAEQHRFYDYLKSNDKVKANQYLLTIISVKDKFGETTGIEIWSKDIKDLIGFRQRLEEGEKLIIDEEKDIDLDDVNRLQRLSELLTGVIDTQDSKRLIEDVEKFLIELKMQEKKLKKIIEHIDTRLDILKNIVPFLF